MRGNDEDLTHLTFLYIPRTQQASTNQTIKVGDGNPQPPSYFRVTGAPWKENPFPQSTQHLLCCQTRHNLTPMAYINMITSNKTEANPNQNATGFVAKSPATVNTIDNTLIADCHVFSYPCTIALPSIIQSK